MLKQFCFAGLLILLGSSLSAAEEADHATHEELRAVLRQTEDAINAGDFDKMLPVISEKIRATPINQEFLSSRTEVSAYFKKWFGGGGYLKKLEMKLTPDALTELSEDKSWGIVRGKGLEKYILADGRPYEMTTRWTATMVKESDGHWRIRSIHIGTDFLNNPILSEAERALGMGVAGGVAGGLLLGLILGWSFFRKKKI
jgi:ketosteroid isomerase-like protein